MGSLWKKTRRVFLPFLLVLGAAITVLNVALALRETQEWLGLTTAGWFVIGIALFMLGASGVLLQVDWKTQKGKHDKDVSTLAATAFGNPAQSEYSQFVGDLRKQHQDEKEELERSLARLRTASNEQSKQFVEQLKAAQAVGVRHQADALRAWDEANKLMAKLEAQRVTEENRASIDDAHKQGVLKTRKSDRPEPQPQRSKGDEELVADIREIWVRYGDVATESLSYLFGEVVSYLRPAFSHLHSGTKYWAEALERYREDFKASRSRLVDRIDDHTAPLSNVRECFSLMYNRYLQLMRWYAEIGHAGDLPSVNELQIEKRLLAWQNLHRPFHDRLKGLVTRPEHRGTLAIFTDRAMIEEPLRSFLAAAGEFDP